MQLKKNKECIICHTKYSYCPNCGEYKNKAWMTSFHDENCKRIFEGICKYSLNHNIDEAHQILSNCDLSVLNMMSQNNINYVNEIMGHKGVEIEQVTEETTSLPLQSGVIDDNMVPAPIESEAVVDEVPELVESNDETSVITEVQEPIESSEAVPVAKTENTTSYKKSFNKNKKH